MPSATAPATSSGHIAPPPRLGWVRHLWRLDLTTPRARYVLRALLSAWLALVAAYLLDLNAPYAAASSVLLVIHPEHGAVIGKGTWRVLGTLAGMLAAFILMSAFGQMPWLFLLGFGAWLGLCVMGMTLLRHFRAYGATLAGYTVGLAAYGALQQPQQTFDLVINRGASVLVGVVSLGVVTALLSRRRMHERITAMMYQLAAATAATLATQADSVVDASQLAALPLDAARRKLLADIYAVDNLLALGTAESADLALRAGAVRQTMAMLATTLVNSVPVARMLDSHPEALRARHAVWAQTWRDIAQHVSLGPAGLQAARRSLHDMRQQLNMALSPATVLSHEERLALLVANDRLIAQVDAYLSALDGLHALQQVRPHVMPVRLPFHRDISAAWQNGLRAMLVVMLGGAFWIVTGWTDGHMMLAGLAAAFALLSTAPNPAAGAVEFIKGTVAAVLLAFPCSFLILPMIDGLPLLLATLGLFWLPGIYATTQPKYGLAGVAYLVAFTTLAAPDNPMRYDFVQYLNGSLAWILATAFTLLGFQLILPRKPARAAERLRQSIHADTQAVLRGAQPDLHQWQWRQQQRMVQLCTLLRSQPDVLAQALEESQTSLQQGRELLRLRQWVRQTSVPFELRAPVAAALQHIKFRADQPRLAARHAGRAARSLIVGLGADPADTTDAQGLSAALLLLAAALARHDFHLSAHSRNHRHAE